VNFFLMVYKVVHSMQVIKLKKDLVNDYPHWQKVQFPLVFLLVLYSRDLISCLPSKDNKHKR